MSPASTLEALILGSATILGASARLGLRRRRGVLLIIACTAATWVICWSCAKALSGKVWASYLECAEGICGAPFRPAESDACAATYVRIVETCKETGVYLTDSTLAVWLGMGFFVASFFIAHVASLFGAGRRHPA